MHIGLDIGTSAVKVAAISDDFKILARAEKEFNYSRPASGQVIIDGAEYIDTITEAIKSVVCALPENARISSVCQASASGNLILLDSNAMPLTPIYTWRDRRATNEIDEVLGDFNGHDLYETIGWPLSNTFPLATLCWLKRRHNGLLKKAAHITMSTEYLNHFLTGNWGISPSAGTPFYLIDQRSRKYHKPFLDKLGIDEGRLPPIYEAGTPIGAVTERASAATGLAPGTPVILGTFDHPAAAIAVGVTKEGQALLSAGTSWVLFYPVKDRRRAINLNLLVDPFLSPDGCWGAMASLSAVSEKINNYINPFISDSKKKFEQLDALSAESLPGAGGLSIDIMSAPDIPKISPYEKRHIARAIMESTALLLKKSMTELDKGGVSADSIVMAGGPSKSPIWREVISNILQKEVTSAEGGFTGAMGAVKAAINKRRIIMSEKLKIGVFGAYRGQSMINVLLKHPNAELVAVCDRFEPALDKVKKKAIENNIKIALYESFDDFEKHPMDAVVLANYANEHAPYAVRLLKAGKHVLSEVLPCETVAQAVELIEAAEESGKVYAYAENYCYMAHTFEMRRRYENGDIGDVMYGEGEYVHDCGSIWYKITYGDENHWRNRMYSTYYCTHSIGPLLSISGQRPRSVVGFETNPAPWMVDLGSKSGWPGGIIIATMDNGAVFKSLHGSLKREPGSVNYQVYGTKGMMESDRWDPKKMSVYIEGEEMCKGELTHYKPESFISPELAGIFQDHGGSDFYSTHFFIEKILGTDDGNKYSIDVYQAVDMGLCGIMAYRSILNGNTPVEIPDLRNKLERDKYRNDHACTNPEIAGDMLIPSYHTGDLSIPEEVYEKVKKEFEKKLYS